MNSNIYFRLLESILMATIIRCSNCNNEIEVSDALSKELESKIIAQNKAAHELEIKKLKDQQAEIEAINSKNLEETKKQITEIAKKEAIERIRKDYDLKIQITKEESEAQAKQNTLLQAQLLELMKQLRESKDLESKLNIEFEKRLIDEQDKIKNNAKKEAEDDLNLKLAIKDKQLADIQKQLQEAQKRSEQGSQQLQGEIQELQMEGRLKTIFIYDEISEVPKGINGADIIQVVKNNQGISCGTILWESKNTKNWTDSWITKLKDDTRTLKADMSIIVSNILPDTIKHFGQIEGVWISDISSAIPLAYALREHLIGVRGAKIANMGKATKAEAIYDYLISNDFKQRIEVWIEYFKNKREDIAKERAFFNKKWEKEEKSMQRILENTVGIYGSIQGLIGNAMPKVEYLEINDDNYDQ